MAKKKSSAPISGNPLPSGTPAASGARRRKSPGPIDQSPISPTTSQTSEEVLATANEMAGGTAVFATGVASTASTGTGSDGPSDTEIAEAAYRRYLQRGGTHGHDLEDWIAAERELRERRR